MTKVPRKSPAQKGIAPMKPPRDAPDIAVIVFAPGANTIKST